jgi:allantoinase
MTGASGAAGPFDLVLRSRRTVLPDGERPAAVGIANGLISAILPYDAPVETRPDGSDADLAGLALLPGLVDTHVHVNEPGRTEWEGFATATRAAALGGITTLIDMPLNSLPPTTSVAALEAKRAAAAAQCAVDVGFWGGAVPQNLTGPDGPAELARLHGAGVFGFKCFLADSGVPEFPPLDGATLDEAVRATAELGALLIVHAEDAEVLSQQSPIQPPKQSLSTGTASDRHSFASFVASRPDEAEAAAVAAVLDAARKHRKRARIHILHLSSAAALAPIRQAREDGVAVTVETCPHYLTLSAEGVPDGTTEFKCCPPIRSAANRKRLWDALGEGLIDIVVSDHSPCPPAMKLAGTGDFTRAWGGIASVQLGLSLVWTAARERGYGLSEVVGWMAQRPADLVGLHTKGRIAVGCAADLAVFDPSLEWTVDAAELAHRHPISPYHGSSLTGRVIETYLRGEPLLGQAPAAPRGKLLP